MKTYLTRLLAAGLVLFLLAGSAAALTTEQALELLEEHYYYDIPREAYGAQTLEELLRLLGDPYTEYMDERQYADFQERVEGNIDLVGIGVTAGFTEEGFLVKRALPGGPALEAGLRSGDLIVAVDGVSCVPATEERRRLLVGEEGTEVSVTVLRDGETLEYRIPRRPVHVPSVQFSPPEDGVGYIACSGFGSDTGRLFSQGLEQYDGQTDCWVLDLRGNGGGYVSTVIEMTSALSGPGLHLCFEDHDGSIAPYTGYSEAVTDKPLILLVDAGSASASEILAANVRDRGRGLLVGNRTYGKGVAQITLDQTSSGYFDGDALKITTDRFYTAGGSTTDRVGVIPTLLVEDRYAEGVAAALAGGGDGDARLTILFREEPFGVDPDTPEGVLSELLSALPPQIPVYLDGVPQTPAQAADGLGVAYDSRWFSDLEDSPYAAAINAMGSYRLLSGAAPGLFRPREPLTRAQLCVMLARALNVSAAGPGRFSDVPDDAWYAGGVNAMAELGLVSGAGEGRFDPGGTLTQEEFLTVMGRTARFLSFSLDAFGAQVEAQEDLLPAVMRAALEPYPDWARSSVAVLAWGAESAMDASQSMLFAPLKQIEPTAPVLREEAAAGMYAVLSGLGILP